MRRVAPGLPLREFAFRFNHAISTTEVANLFENDCGTRVSAISEPAVLGQRLCERVNDCQKTESYQKAPSAALSRFQAASLPGKPKRSQFAFSGKARTQIPASPRCWNSALAAGVCTSRNRLVPPTSGNAKSAS